MTREKTIARLVEIARFARDNGYGVLSTGEQMGYTIGQAIYRLDEG